MREDGDVISGLIALLLVVAVLILFVLIAPGAGHILRGVYRSSQPGQGNHTSARRGSRGVIDLRWQVVWPDSMAGWCFWASLVALIGVIGVLLVGVAVALTGGGGAEDVLLQIVQIGFAGVVGLFLLGVVLAVVRSVRGERTGGRRSIGRRSSSG